MYPAVRQLPQISRRFRNRIYLASRQATGSSKTQRAIAGRAASSIKAFNSNAASPVLKSYMFSSRSAFQRFADIISGPEQRIRLAEAALVIASEFRRDVQVDE